MDLENLLKEHGDLFASLEDIKRYAARIWDAPLMPWFTQHNLDHSRRIIDILGQLLEPFSRQADFLNEHELYVLLAAAYLHDIGMQDLTSDGKWVNNLTPEDYDDVRVRHAAVSCEIILQGKLLNDASTQEKVLPAMDIDYRYAIAYVAKGHSSKNYYDMLEIFQQDDMLNLYNRPFRGGLLTSLLLIADELDLTHLRVNMESLAHFNLSAFSQVHWYAHHYTNAVKIDQALAEITMMFPDPSADYSQMFVTLVDQKIKQQMALINPVLRHSFPLMKLECSVKAVKTNRRQELPTDVVNTLRELVGKTSSPGQQMAMPGEDSGRQIEFVYRFIPYGTHVTADNSNPDWRIKPNRIFIDVGSAQAVGAIDLHDSRGYRFKGRLYESATALMCLSPDLVTGNVTGDAGEVELCVHRFPDFDCFAGVYIARQLILHNGSLPRDYSLLMEYAEDIDRATMEINSNCLKTPYVIANVLDEVIRMQNPGLTDPEIFERTLARGVELVDYAMSRLQHLNPEVRNLYNPALLADNELFKQEYDIIANDYDNYIADIEQKAAYFVKGQLMSRDDQIPGLVHGIFWHDQPRCKLAKYWARSDYFNSPDSRGFDLTFIPVFNSDHRTDHPELGSVPISRVIIALKSDSRFTLKNLAIMLEKAELAKEVAIFGEKTGLWRDRSTRRYSENWCTNRDPWYDGRDHGYTIVDSPNCGSLLGIDEIRAVVFEYLGAAKMSTDL